MNVTESGFKNRQPHMEDYLQIDDNLLDLILRKENLNRAYKQVNSNKGSGGIDRMQVDELLPCLRENQETLIQGIRGMANNSFVFRPNRGAHDALRQC